MNEHQNLRIGSPDNAYLGLVHEVITYGERRPDRTGTGTMSLFGAQLRFDLRAGFPLLTTKRVNFDAVVKELLWFLRGETNTKTLGCGIWDEWADPTGDIGPGYGAQWRGWHDDRWGPTDQIAEAERLIREDPTSRRIIVSAWNVADLPAMALAPCHAMFQFYVGLEDGKPTWLDCQLYQRSADLALGAPFNIASYALLTEMMAAATGLRARHFVHTFGDAHVYLNHVDGLTEQLGRGSFPSPTVRFTKRVVMTPINLTPDDVVLEDYRHHPAIKFKVAV